jgi:hypothetical protein
VGACRARPSGGAVMTRVWHAPRRTLDNNLYVICDG